MVVSSVRSGILKTLTAVSISAPLSLGMIAGANAAVISNGTIQLGVNPEAHLNVYDSSVGSSLSGTGAVGLRYLPTGAESTAAGCLCEGWGVADGATGLTGYANVAVGGVSGLTLKSFTNDATTATSVVSLSDLLKVTHAFAPSAVTKNLYKATVTIENTGTSDVADLRYRRVMDWDIEPTAFSEVVTVKTGGATNVLFTSDNGFATGNPLGGRGSISATGEFVNSGPTDHGALFDFGFGKLAAGATKTFDIFYGAAGNEEDALAALTAVGADQVYSLAKSRDYAAGATNTFVFGFKGVGEKTIPEPSAMLGLLGLGAFGVTSLRKRKQASTFKA